MVAQSRATGGFGASPGDDVLENVGNRCNGSAYALSEPVLPVPLFSSPIAACTNDMYSPEMSIATIRDAPLESWR
jgi:hypothetical protein